MFENERLIDKLYFLRTLQRIWKRTSIRENENGIKMEILLKNLEDYIRNENTKKGLN